MKKVTIYMRLSKEDEYIRDESNSISNQRAFLLKHIRSIPELKNLEVLEFKDMYNQRLIQSPAHGSVEKWLK